MVIPRASNDWRTAVELFNQSVSEAGISLFVEGLFLIGNRFEISTPKSKTVG